MGQTPQATLGCRLAREQQLIHTHTHTTQATLGCRLAREQQLIHSHPANFHNIIESKKKKNVIFLGHVRLFFAEKSKFKKLAREQQLIHSHTSQLAEHH